MAQYSGKNLFASVNPILNSILQDDRTFWGSFHNELVSVIVHTLDANLPRNYHAIVESGLQARLDIHKAKAWIRASIYETTAGTLYGRLVTCIEVLTPTSKTHHPSYFQYLTKRVQLLKAQTSLIEIDILHESRPFISNIPSYPDHDEGALPYTIAVSKPQPSFEEGEFSLYGAEVATSLPTIAVPLLGSDSIALDLQEIYNKTFSSLRIFALMVDYEQEPVNFGHYQALDQEYIQKLLEAIRLSR